MIRLCKYNPQNLIDKIQKGQLDAMALSITNLILRDFLDNQF